MCKCVQLRAAHPRWTPAHTWVMVLSTALRLWLCVCACLGSWAAILVMARGIFSGSTWDLSVAAPGIFRGGTWDLPWRRVGLLPRPGLRPQPLHWGVESSPLVHQGSPWPLCYYFLTSVRGLWPICAALFYFAVWLCWVSLAARGLGLWDQIIHVPCAGRQILAHSATREVPSVLFSNVVV